ncbi:putative Mediator of RNA polymerase II transcription subunit 18 [Seiridium unicorne]|uniref:Mediator of RNA polymerase II transcription subunit 18 n=1 Tax=Seiridium unicorne TaxID=138068 RepID=A0ABR2UJS9_9PEZI
MHELFLTSTIKDGDLEKACAVLQGLSWMSARHNVYRVTYYAGQPKPKGLPNLKSIPASRHGASWNELHRELTRLSYVFHLVHEVLPDKDFGTPNALDLNGMAGTLHWTGFPDPPREKGQLTTHRKKIDIPDQKQLLAIMASNGQAYVHTIAFFLLKSESIKTNRIRSYKTELIQETYTFIRDNIEFVLSRNYYLPSVSEVAGPSSSLPAWSDLKPVDPARKWMFQVKRDVIEDSQPEKMKQAQKDLLEVKAELEAIFSFVPIDRRVLDTRITPPPTIPGQHP